MVHPVVSVGGRERSAGLIGRVGLDYSDQIAENVLRELFPVPGRIGDRGLVAGIGVGGGADAVGLDGLDGAPEAVVGVDGPCGGAASRRVGLGDLLDFGQRRAGAGGVDGVGIGVDAAGVAARRLDGVGQCLSGRRFLSG